MLPYLKKCYTTILDGVDETSVTTEFQRYACCRFNGDLFWSTMSRGDRSAFLLARWCKFGGRIDTSGSDLRPGAHPSRYSLGAPVEVWCKDIFECEGGASFRPVQRIHGKFIPANDNYCQW
ncbi:hypothetical protein P5673_023197 [Acropora cervicornis]|uniref:Uncharacterized protein n=1 Tax=Acropora cervicornis TaxID=6130 RepID=A0AAD9Q5P5_ACRCE|nr:hypothetical protein P5673_023197 [Acropora cervicornis]